MLTGFPSWAGGEGSKASKDSFFDARPCWNDGLVAVTGLSFFFPFQMQKLLLRCRSVQLAHTVCCGVATIWSFACIECSIRRELGRCCLGLVQSRALLRVEGEKMTPTSLNKYRILERRVSPCSSLRKHLGVEESENHASFLCCCGEASKQHGPGPACSRQRTGRAQGTPESWLPLPVARNLIPSSNDEEESALRVASSPSIIFLTIFSVFSHDFRFFSWAHRGAGKPPCAPSSCASPRTLDAGGEKSPRS
jgi:hypothetical protein